MNGDGWHNEALRVSNGYTSLIRRDETLLAPQ